MYNSFLDRNLSRFSHHILGKKLLRSAWCHMNLWLEKTDVIVNRALQGGRFLSQTTLDKIGGKSLWNLISTSYLGYYATQALSRLQKVEAQVYVGSQAISEETGKQWFPTSTTEENSERIEGSLKF